MNQTQKRAQTMLALPRALSDHQQFADPAKARIAIVLMCAYRTLLGGKKLTFFSSVRGA